MNRKNIQTALALGLAFVPVTAFAMNQTEMPEIVVSATKTEKSLQEAPSTVSVVDGDESAQYGNNSIADMVKDVPGVEVFDNSVAGSKRLMIRGENGGRVIVLVDGQKINEQKSMDGAPLLIDPATVERIEVVKGAGSVLYGSEAIGGVVNIITKKGGDKTFGGTIAAGYNSGTSGADGTVSVNGESGGVMYRFTGSYSDQGDRETPEGTLEGSDSLMKSFSGFLGYQNDQLEAGLTAEQYDVEADVPPIRVMGSPFDLNLPEWSRDKVGAYVDFIDINNFIPKVHFDAYYQKTFKDFRQDMQILMGGPFPVGFHLHTDNDQKTYALNAQVDMAPADAHYLIGGLAYSNDSLDAVTKNSFSIPFIPPSSFFQEANIKSWALYLQDEWSLTNAVTLTLGVRETWVESELEKTNDRRIRTGSVSDSHPAFSAGLTWNSTDELTMRALFSQGYRFPDLGKLFIGTTHGGSITLANQNLDPETSNNFETGVRFDNNHLKADIALFYNLAENYINRRALGPGIYRYENVDTAKTIGLEMWIGYRFESYNLTPYFNGTLMRRQYEDFLLSTWDTNTPLFTGRIGTRFEQPLASMPMKVWGDLYVRTATEADEEIIPGMVMTNDAWSTVNLALGVRWGEDDSWKASINFNNILDESYTTAQNSLPEPGFNVVARVSLDF